MDILVVHKVLLAFATNLSILLEDLVRHPHIHIRYISDVLIVVFSARVLVLHAHRVSFGEDLVTLIVVDDVYLVPDDHSCVAIAAIHF